MYVQLKLHILMGINVSIVVRMNSYTSSIMKRNSVWDVPMGLTIPTILIRLGLTIHVQKFLSYPISQPSNNLISISKSNRKELWIISTNRSQIWPIKEFLFKNVHLKPPTSTRQLSNVSSYVNRKTIYLIFQLSNAYFVRTTMKSLTPVRLQFQDTLTWQITIGLWRTMILWGLFNGEMT